MIDAATLFLTQISLPVYKNSYAKNTALHQRQIAPIEFLATKHASPKLHDYLYRVANYGTSYTTLILPFVSPAFSPSLQISNRPTWKICLLLLSRA
jgi:hypothetical protein